MVSLIRRNHGQSVIEFALVLPLLLILLFGIVEFGRAWMTMNILTSAAREGCRLAVVTDPDVTLVTTRVTDVCNSAGLTNLEITIVPPDATDPSRRVTVTVGTEFRFIWGDIGKLFGSGTTLVGTLPLRATSVMRHESF